MNNTRRKELQKQIDSLQEIKEALESIANDEQEAYDNMPEGLQESERGSNMYDNIDELGSIQDDIQSLCDQIEEIINK